MKISGNPHFAFAQIGKKEGETIYWGREYGKDNIVRWICRKTLYGVEYTQFPVERDEMKVW